jgi:acetyl esterase/lipase
VPQSRPERILLYLHGGSFAFRFPNIHAALAARLCRTLQARALIPDYRLAPEHPFPAAPDDCHAAYRWLAAVRGDTRDIVLVGDSAGGTLALVTLHRARVAGEPMPACAGAPVPGSGLHAAQPQHVREPAARSAPAARRADGAAAALRSLPRALHPSRGSPLFADFTGFPPLFFQAGSTELLRDEATRAAEKAFEAGVDVEFELWPRALHVFQAALFLPESALAIDNIARFVRARTGWSDPASSP